MPSLVLGDPISKYSVDFCILLCVFISLAIIKPVSLFHFTHCIGSNLWQWSCWGMKYELAYFLGILILPLTKAILLLFPRWLFGLCTGCTFRSLKQIFRGWFFCWWFSVWLVLFGFFSFLPHWSHILQKYVFRKQ